MGTYIYGVSSRSRKIKGFDQPVYDIRFIGKDTFSTCAPGHRVQRIKSRYQSKPSMLNSLVAFDLFEDSDEYIAIYRYQLLSNTFADSSMDYPKNILKPAGFAKRVGNRYVKITTMEYTMAMKASQKPWAGVEIAIEEGRTV